ncbi:MAG: hypothetical protein R3293_12315 [Candidatus Promineifilaceae bacterium]|nr:hypothetical protein [Candidatus Promineifilaceae bacterium]
MCDYWPFADARLGSVNSMTGAHETFAGKCEHLFDYKWGGVKEL